MREKNTIFVCAQTYPVVIASEVKRSVAIQKITSGSHRGSASMLPGLLRCARNDETRVTHVRGISQ